MSREYGKGKLVNFDADQMLVFIQFEGPLVRFQYPETFFNKYLTLSEENFKLVKRDARRGGIINE